jgi:hypothetical protein
MTLSKIIFKVFTVWPAIVVGNLAILALIYVSGYSSIVGMPSEYIANLRSEAISTIVIAWGVILESRQVLLNNAQPAEFSAIEFADELTADAERTGILLLIMGLLLEMVTYFDVDVRAEMLPTWLHVVIHACEWVVLAVIASELLLHSYRILKLKIMR